MAVVVVAFERPKYLDICLTSIFNVHGIERVDVFADVDGGGTCVEEVAEVVGKYPCADLNFRESNIGNGAVSHHTMSLAWVFEKGYDSVLFTDSDVLFAPSLLQSLLLIDKDWDLICLAGNSKVNPSNIIKREIFDKLFAYVSNHEYVGLQRVWFDGVLLKKHDIWDSCYGRFVKDNNCRIIPAHPSLDMVLHFGAVGRNTRDVELDDKLFAQDRMNWIPNILRYKPYLFPPLNYGDRRPFYYE
jgi:hypothetical protein